LVFKPSRALGVQKVVLRRLAFWVLLAALMSQAAWAAANFTPQRRVGYSTGDQWEPALAADGHGHIYILFPQYGAVSDCTACSIPTMSLLVSSDNGLSWEPPHPLVPSSSGQFDPQIVEVFMAIPEQHWVELRENLGSPFRLTHLKNL